ncbi:MAG: CocE/NonD family hydrolase [Intrasporangium sp.]|uniref:CocE/NonD family hydrolase n=1 Tax=Intrasporangium sp. TaxID=1925024 RepID=UPI00264A4582|nr:CocE/NonD family hydrolase [Intrasporangium sp.]MDN5796050.1 CocE/NonD family hydrolase [Intrasporangium sp.]
MAAAQAGTVPRPWRLPGGTRYGLGRLKGILRPAVTLHEPPAGSMLVDRDVEVSMRDGTILRVNVHRPADGQPAPVLLSAHPYGKDRVPGRRARIPLQYRLMRLPGPIRHSTLTGWEAPDPAWWVAHGYVVVNADVRGAGRSEGVCEPFSEQEAQDVYDLVEWAAAQPWSSGAVGLLGVSYLAISQYRPAALRPPALQAICPWEGLTDPYRDLMRPGGLLEDGFVRLWGAGIRRRTRAAIDVRAAQRQHPLRDTWWQSLTPDLGDIEVPMLVCASFSDNNVHSRGSFRAFQQAGSAQRFAYTHRGGKWSVFYSEGALAVQLAFFDRYLRAADVPAPPRIRLEVREDRDRVVAVREEHEWPLARTEWRPLYLSADGHLAEAPPTQPGSIVFDTRRAGAAFVFTTPRDTELTGPMAARLWVQVDGDDDVELCLGMEKWRGRRYVGFEGSYGWGRDRVATGWQKASLRELDESRSTPGEPVHTFTHRQPLTPGEVVPVDIALGPSATLFRGGESLRLVVAGRWLSTRNPLTGQFPAHYRSRPAARCTLHWGPDRPAHLLVPYVPAP